MKAVWLVRSHQLLSRMRFWTAIVGYDSRDRSVSQRIYLTYVIVFFSLWGFAMLALIADPLARVLPLVKGFSPVQVAVILTTAVLLADALLRSLHYAKRSPFNFSEEDAQLICLTPVDRRKVAIAWLLGDWFPVALPYWAGVVALSFACQQLATPTGMVWLQLPVYILKGLRTVSIVLPLQLALMSFTYAFGALRLQRDREFTSLQRIPLVAGLCLLLLAIFLPTSLNIILFPILFPLMAGFGEAKWIGAFILVVLMAASSLLLLYLVTPQLNLSRAAQESNFPLKFQNQGMQRRKADSDR
jgi:hypothetical protein